MRVTPSTPSSVIVGELIAIRDSALVVRTQGYRGDVTIPRSAVLRLEVSRGTNRAQSAGYGALMGVVVGGVIGYTRGNDHCYDSWFCFDRRGAAILGGATGVVTGSLIGLLVGSVERWRDAAVPVSLSVAPTRPGSIALGARITF